MVDKLICGFNRHSFDRFGDDLCEELLKYVSFEDKIKYECVCKQLRKTIYNRQHILQIENVFFSNKHNTLRADRVLCYYDNQITELSNTSIIERLLKKCKYINHVIIGDNLTNKTTITYDQLLGIIADNCHNLLSIEYYEYETNFTKDMWQYFGSKCGQTLRTITFQPWDLEFKPENLLPYCPNVRCLINAKLSQLIDEQIDDIFLSKLNEIQLFYEPETNTNHLMGIFVNRYINTIKVFKSQLNGDDCIQFIEHLSQLIHLEKLSLDIRDANNSVFVKSFQNLSLKCKNILHLSIEMEESTETTPYSTYTRLLKSINNFSKLEYLQIRISEEEFVSDPIDSWGPTDTYEKFSVNLLKNCSELTYLEIKSNMISDDFVCDIDSYLPKLNLISISTANILTDQTMNFLSQSRLLKRVSIDNNGSTITDTGVSNLIDNCFHLKSLTFRWFKELTNDSIDKLIEIAKQRPKVNFTVRFINKFSSNENLIQHMVIVKESITPNLDIKFENFEDLELDDFYDHNIDDMNDHLDDYEFFDGEDEDEDYDDFYDDYNDENDFGF